MCLGETADSFAAIVSCSDPTAAVIEDLSGAPIAVQVSHKWQDVHYATCLGQDESGNAVAVSCGAAPLLVFNGGTLETSGLCLTAATKADGAAATFAACDPTNNNQQFTLTGMKGLSSQEVLNIKDSQYCLQLEAAGNADFYTCNAFSTQRWMPK